MKRFVLALAVAAGSFFSQTSFAQVQLGFRGGAHWGTVSKPSFLASYTPDFRLSAGPQGALFLDIPLGSSVSFRPEVGYAQQGVIVREAFDLNIGSFPIPLGASVALQTQNISTAMLAKINLGNGAIQPYLIAGPAVSYAASSRVRARSEGLFRSRPLDLAVPMGGLMNRWDVQGLAGAGLTVPAGAGQFMIEGRYVHGFTRQLEVPIVQLPVRNRGISVSLGYSFSIGR